jgi:hypothetical protein
VKIVDYMQRFFDRKEVVPEKYEEPHAFDYKTYPAHRSYHACPGDVLNATICDEVGEAFTVKEEIKQAMIVDGVAIFRTQDAFGMENVIGAAFGKIKR